jgi:transposase
MLHAGLDLSRKKIDVCLLSQAGEIVEEWASPPDADGLRGLARRAGTRGLAVRGVIESMTGARFVHDTLEELGWEMLIADAAKVKGLAPLACKTDKIDARVLAVLSQRDLVPEIWLPDPSIRRERELARFRLHLVKHRSMLKHRIHATLITFGHPCPVTDLFGVAGRELLDRFEIPSPWRSTVDASLELIGDLEAQKLCGYTGLCPRVNQSGDRDRRGPLTKQGPKYLRWAMLEASMHALRHPAYRERYQRNKRRLGRQRGAKVAQIDVARKLTEAIWHMLTNDQPFAPAPGGSTFRLAA